MSGDDRDPSAQPGAPSILCGRLAEASRRIRLLRAPCRAVRFALFAHLILVPWVLLRGLLPLPFEFYILALLLVTVAGAACGLLSPLPPSLVTRLLDHRLALKERLGSALEVMHRQEQPMATPSWLTRQRLRKAPGSPRPFRWPLRKKLGTLCPLWPSHLPFSCSPHCRSGFQDLVMS